MTANNNIDSILKNFGIKIGKSSVKPIKDLDKNINFFISYESLYILIEKSPYEQKQDYLLFLDLNYKKYATKKGAFACVEVFKKSDEKYIFIEPIKDLTSLGFLNKKKEISQEFIQEIIDKIPKKNFINVPMPHGEKEIKEYNAIYEKFLSKNYCKLWGTRELKEYEKDKIILATGKFEPKSVKEVNPQRILERLNSKLALQKDVVNLLFNSMSFHDIFVGNIPKNSGIVLYGPGGTGKTTIMKEFMEVFEKLGSYVALNDENEILKTSEVKDTKYYGAYQDYFTPKFTKAIREARIRGVPSFIPIDEGDIFVENPKDPKGHGPDVINFFKAHVGNHSEFIVCLATNVLKGDLNPIAVRRGRINTVEIPYPDVDIAKRLIEIFIDEYKINLIRPLSDEELTNMAKFLVKHQKPGSNISYFCKNFYNVSVDVVEEYSTGKKPEEVEAIISGMQNQPISPQEFMDRYFVEILDKSEEEENVVESLEVDLENEFMKTEQDVFFKNLLHSGVSGVVNLYEKKLNFSSILRDFYLSSKGTIYMLQSNNGINKLDYYRYLVYMVKLLPIIFNNKSFKKKLVFLDDSEMFDDFLDKLLQKFHKVPTQDEFISAILGILNSYDSKFREEINGFIRTFHTIEQNNSFELLRDSLFELEEYLNKLKQDASLDIDEFLNYISKIKSQLLLGRSIDIKAISSEIIKGLNDLLD